MKKYIVSFIILLFAAGAVWSSTMGITKFLPPSFKGGVKMVSVVVDSTVAAAQYSDTTVIAKFHMPGRILGVEFTPARLITGADTNYRTWIVGLMDTTGTVTKLDSIAFTDGIDIEAGAPYAIYGDSIDAISEGTAADQYDSVVLIDVATGNGISTPRTFWSTIMSWTAQ